MVFLGNFSFQKNTSDLDCRQRDAENKYEPSTAGKATSLAFAFFLRCLRAAFLLTFIDGFSMIWLAKISTEC